MPARRPLPREPGQGKLVQQFCAWEHVREAPHDLAIRVDVPHVTVTPGPVRIVASRDSLHTQHQTVVQSRDDPRGDEQSFTGREPARPPRASRCEGEDPGSPGPRRPWDPPGTPWIPKARTETMSELRFGLGGVQLWMGPPGQVLSSPHAQVTARPWRRSVHTIFGTSYTSVGRVQGPSFGTGHCSTTGWSQSRMTVICSCPTSTRSDSDRGIRKRCPSGCTAQ